MYDAASRGTQPTRNCCQFRALRGPTLKLVFLQSKMEMQMARGPPITQRAAAAGSVGARAFAMCPGSTSHRTPSRRPPAMKPVPANLRACRGRRGRWTGAVGTWLVCKIGVEGLPLKFGAAVYQPCDGACGVLERARGWFLRARMASGSEHGANMPLPQLFVLSPFVFLL